LNIPNSTVQHIIRRFRVNGNRLISNRYRSGRKTNQLPEHI
jgi:hypothetical protein